jgi:hypothetical protein
MGSFLWSHEKNAQLLADRGLCFEAVVAAIEAGDLLDVLEHPQADLSPGDSESGAEPFPMAKISQPPSTKDEGRGRLCFAYAALAALETMGITADVAIEGKALEQEELEDFLVKKINSHWAAELV